MVFKLFVCRYDFCAVFFDRGEVGLQITISKPQLKNVFLICTNSIIAAFFCPGCRADELLLKMPMLKAGTAVPTGRISVFSRHVVTEDQRTETTRPARTTLELVNTTNNMDNVKADVEAVRRAVEHCNADHADAVLDMSKAFTGLNHIEAATMLSIDRFGFDVLCKTRDGSRHCL